MGTDKVGKHMLREEQLLQLIIHKLPRKYVSEICISSSNIQGASTSFHWYATTTKVQTINLFFNFARGSVTAPPPPIGTIFPQCADTSTVCFSEIYCNCDPLIGNDRETSNYITALAKLWLSKQASFHGNNCTATEERCFLCGTCQDVISRTC
jgi:hypothetical protein